MTVNYLSNQSQNKNGPQERQKARNILDQHGGMYDSGYWHVGRPDSNLKLDWQEFFFLLFFKKFHHNLFSRSDALNKASCVWSSKTPQESHHQVQLWELALSTPNKSSIYKPKKLGFELIRQISKNSDFKYSGTNLVWLWCTSVQAM